LAVFHFGITCDAASASDAWMRMAAIRAELAELRGSGLSIPAK
jgi:hypothetical protein